MANEDSPSSDYMRELIRKGQDQQRLLNLLQAGAQSAPTAPMDATYFDTLRQRIRNQKSM